MSSTTGETLAGTPRSVQSGHRGWVQGLVRGKAEDAAWVRPALLGLLAATALLYLVDLGINGWANGFYSAAVEAGTKSWKAFFFGSFDSSNFITVDKPPASLWVMDISARLFGLNAWSILVPQALEGVGAVGLLYATVRRPFGAGAGLIAGAVLALTPVAALMFRFNNPDALLCLLVVGAAYALTRSLEHGSARWLLLAGALIGFGFLAKMMQAFVVVPGFAAVYLLAAPTSLRRRLLQLLGSGVAMIVAAGWWVAIVTLWPAASRPYIGGSQNNSILNLIFGYNGFGRITGNETGSVVGGHVFGSTAATAAGGFGRAGGGAAGGSMWGATGIGRLFGSEMGTQISWLLPAALLSTVSILWVTRRARRTDGKRAGVLIWGTWLVVTGLVFSFAQGIIHPYYTVALAPAIGALVGIGAASAWRSRELLMSRIALAVGLGATVIWAYVLLDRTPTWLPWLRTLVLVAGLIVAAVIALGMPLARKRRFAAEFVAILALLVSLAAPAAYAIETVQTAHSGSLPSAGPSGSVSQGGPGGGRGGFGAGGGGAAGFAPTAGGGTGFGRPGGTGGGFARPSGATGGFTRPTGGAGRFARPGAAAGSFAGGPGGGSSTGGRGGGLGGLLNTTTPSKALVKLLDLDASRYTWIAATIGSNSAAGVELSTEHAVMAIGGFNGTDPTPTLAQFKAYVAAGKIHYFLASTSGGGGAGNSSSSSAITTWVTSHFKSSTVGGVTLYDLSAASSS